MKKRFLSFLALVGLSFLGLQAEIVNYRKAKTKEELPNPLPSDTVKEKNFEPISFNSEFIPKPNTPPIAEKEKIIVPLTPPSDPARPQAKQPSQFSRPFTQKLITTINFSPNPENPHKGVVYSPIDIGSVVASMEGRIAAIDYMDGLA